MVDIVNIVNVSIAAQGRKLGFYNVNNVMLLSDETPIADFGTDKYRAYVSANDVKNDFGSESMTYKMALAAFAQTPNMLAGNGQLLIGLMEKTVNPATKATGSITFSGQPVANDTITIGSNTYTFDTDITIGADLEGTIENIVAATWDDVVVTGTADGISIEANTAGAAGNTIGIACDSTDATVSGSFLSGGTDETVDVEEYKDAISRMYGLVYFGGVLTTKDMTSEEMIEASDTVQALDCLLILPSADYLDMEEGGLFATIIGKGNYKTKCVLYTLSKEKAYTMAAAYAGRGFATNYSAQNSCITMNLKDLATIEADTGISQTLYNKAKALGVDLYTDIEGLPKVISNSGLVGEYFDQLINRLWFTQTVKVEVFNTLAGTNSKIPQTEAGMNSLKNAVRGVCERAVNNGFLAPGKWNSADKFGNIEDFVRNIADNGYYIYSSPIADQSQTEREARKAPVIQMAGKEAGAIHSADLILSFEA